jgi:hypothetical protein
MDGNDMAACVVLFLLINCNLNFVARNSPGNEHHFPVAAANPRRAVREAVDGYVYCLFGHGRRTIRRKTYVVNGNTNSEAECRVARIFCYVFLPALLAPVF